MGNAPIQGVVPTPERARRGVERVEHAIADDQGRPSQPYRSIDILAAMEKRSAITAAMRVAGETFRSHFTMAQLDPLKAVDWSSPTVSGRRPVPLSSPIENARESVWRALLHVGGIGSAGGSCLWHVIGLESSLKKWATEQGWRVRRVSEEAASGILIGALSALEAHYELDTKPSERKKHAIR